MEHLNALPVGTRLGEYEIEAVLGAGGFGITYRAVDVTLNKVVAIKEYLPRDFATRTNTRTVVPTSSADRADYEWGLARFVDEARTLARFNHPRVNQVHRFFEANGTAYMVLDYIAGETLSRVLEREGRLSEAAVFRLLDDVLSGLEEVHGAEYVHRDIKPGNLMTQPDGSTIILDFGAARQAVGQRSKSVTSILTPGYAPIEQYDTKAEDVGPWSDIYALGMVAYRCISGLRDGDLPDAVTRSRATRRGSGDLEPAASSGRGQYDARLLRAIDWAIQVEENERPQSLTAWRQALPALTARQGEAGPPVRTDTAQKGARWATVAGVVALLVAVAGGAYWYVRQAESPAVVSRTSIPEAHQAEPPVQRESEPVPESRQAVSAVPTPEEPPPPTPAEVETELGLDRAARVLVQQGLLEAGQEPGPADGMFGGEQTRTRQAIRAWQAAKGLAETGYLTREQAETLIDLGQGAAEARRVVEAQAADDRAYVEAQQADTAEAYESYLATYPAGRHVDAARERQAAAKQREQAAAAQADDAAYAEAQRLDTTAAYGDYLAAYPQGRHVAEARAAQAQAVARQRAARDRVLAQLNAQMVRVPGGPFRMGCQEWVFSSDRGCNDDEQPAHQVEVRSFEISKYEVTQELWEAVMGERENPSRFQNCPRCPVERVSWDNIRIFLQKLNAGGGRYRLPSEAEWEYAARGGQESQGYQYAGSNTPGAVAWYRKNSGGRPHPVGQKQANELGLYDLSGNVWEWVQDCWNSSYTGAPSDGRAWERGDCSRRVLRGGSWYSEPRTIRSANRYRYTAVNRNNNHGFRIARSLP